MESIACIQGQGEGIREPLVLVPISEGIPQDIQEIFGVQGSQEGLQDLHLTPDLEQSTPLFYGEMKEKQDLIQLIQEQSKISFYNLRISQD